MQKWPARCPAAPRPQLIGNAQLPRFDLQRKDLREDAALRQASGVKPQSLLPSGPPHAVEFAFLVEAPDRADALTHRIAEYASRRCCLALVACGEDDQVSGFHAPVLHHCAVGSEPVDVAELDQPDTAVDDHLRATGIEIVP